jgi:hypothetical protein
MILKALNFIQSNKLQVSFLIFSFISLAYSFKNSKFIELNGNCGNDGSTYCSMAMGNIEFQPYSRRTLLPKIVGMISKENVVTTFYLLNFTFLILAAIFLCLIQNKINSKFNLVTLGLFMINISTFRMLFSYPVLTDYFAILLILIFFYSYLFFHDNYRIITIISILIMLCFVRENLSLTLSLSMLILSILQRKIKLETLVYLITSIIFTYLSFKQPFTVNYVHESSVLKNFIISVRGNFADFGNTYRFFYLTLMGVTPVAVAALFYKPSLKNRLTLVSIFSSILIISHSLLNLGNPESRLMLIPGVLLQLVIFQKVKSPKMITALIIATVVLWEVRQFSDGSYESYLAMFGQPYLPVEFSYSQSLERLKIFVLIMLIWAFCEVFARIVRRRKGARSPSVGK